MKLRLATLAVVMTLVSSACIRAEIDLVVDDDGTVEYGGVIAADPDAIQRVTELFGGFEDFEDGGTEEIPSRDEICDDFVDEQGFDDMPEADGLEASVEPYDEDGFCGVRFQVSGPLEAANQTLSEGTSPVTLRREPDGGWFFELPLGDGDAGDAGDLAEFPGLGDIFDDARYVVRVKLPGRQVEHNADGFTSDGTAVWDIDLLNPPGSTLFLRTEPGEPETGDLDGSAGGSAGGDDDGGNGIVVALLIVAGLIALGILAFVLLRRRRGSEQSPTSTIPGAFPPVATGPSAAPTWDQTVTAPQPVVSPTMPTPVVTGSDPRSTNPGDSTVAPAAPATPEPTTPNTPPVIASPTPEQAIGVSVWDPVRRAYVQWDPVAGRWMRFDDASGQWQPEG